MNDAADPFSQLERSHRRLEERLEDLQKASAAETSGEALEVAREVAGWISRAVRRHEEDEERSLFPRLREHAIEASLLDKLAHEHREHEALHARLDAVVATLADADGASHEGLRELGVVTDALVRAYRAHIEEEEAVLFPAARAALDAAALEAIAREMDERRGGGGGGRRR